MAALAVPYLRRPSFLKVFNRLNTMEELFVDDNLFKHGDFMTFTLVDVGTFYIKRYAVRTGVPPLTDEEDYVYAPDDDVPTPFVETTYDYQPSDSDTNSLDDSGYEDDHDALDLDGRLSFTVTVRKGWKRFRRGNGLADGDRLHFTLVNLMEVTFYVVIEKT
ncbi:hypothetical protein SASPL_128906 [Salvia splendens]|uniref:TF-B3 domain-containing protein n=1 Tax=Salvia splendens TaxID=180675 RepID=A0A8X8ZMI3_SALSN|nr:hypothetical protein SASPL_128906 [Salvia splendens]